MRPEKRSFPIVTHSKNNLRVMPQLSENWRVGARKKQVTRGGPHPPPLKQLGYFRGEIPHLLLKRIARNTSPPLKHLHRCHGGRLVIPRRGQNVPTRTKIFFSLGFNTCSAQGVLEGQTHSPLYKKKWTRPKK